MARFLRKKDQALGRPPGSLVFIGDHKMDRSLVRMKRFDQDTLIEEDIERIADAVPPPDASQVTWINVYGLEDTELVREIGQVFDIHPLVLEDILNTDQRPKMEEVGDYVFLVVKMLRFDPEDPDTILAEQLSLVLGRNLLLTFQERKGDVFEPVRERLRNKVGRIRTLGADYLMYSLLDTVVDNYIHIVERLGERVEDVDEAILDEDGDDDEDILQRISWYKQEMNYLRKAIRPSREAFLQLAKLDSNLINDQTYPFLRDLYDLETQASEAIDTYREILSDQLNTYRTAVGMKLNEIMKVLTIFAAIFIPLTFIAGIYGMNFDYLPELHFRYSYFVLWGVMLVVAGIMLRYFYRKGWL